MLGVRERICNFTPKLFEEMQRKTQKYARLPNRYLYQLKIPLTAFCSKGYLLKIIL